MNIKMLKAALAGLVLSVSGFANAGLIFSNVSYDASSISFTVEGDLSGYSTPNQNFGFGIEYYGDVWAGVSTPASNSWSSSIFDSFSISDNGFTGVWSGYNSDEPYSWSHYNGDLTGAVVSSKTITLTLGDNYLNTSALNPHFDFIWGWAGDEQSNTVLHSHTTQVPEPSTLAIFALGIMGLASRKFKKQ
jgi:hypothetical protein